MGEIAAFYSYKGGVGRTMALVNTAVALARLGRRVLVVDFDLEAPGLPSYQAFQSAECERGLVDYVNSYRTTGIAPNASEFIASCEVEGSKVEGSKVEPLGGLCKSFWCFRIF